MLLGAAIWLGMAALLAVCVVWVRWGRNTGVHVGPGVAPTFGRFVHRAAHIIRL